MPQTVNIQSTGETWEFPDEASPEQIQTAIRGELGRRSLKNEAWRNTFWQGLPEVRGPELQQAARREDLAAAQAEGPAPVIASSPTTLSKLPGAVGGNLAGAALKGLAVGMADAALAPVGDSLPSPVETPLQREVRAEPALAKRQRIEANPTYQIGQWFQDKAAGIMESVPERERGTVAAQLTESVSSLAPIAAGPAAPLLFGLLKTGEVYDSGYQAAVEAGKSPNEAAEIAANQALLSGVKETAVWQAGPVAFRKFIGQRIARTAGTSMSSRWLAQTIGSGAELGTVSATAQAGQNVIEGKPVAEGTGTAGVGGFLLGSVLGGVRPVGPAGPGEIPFAPEVHRLLDRMRPQFEAKPGTPYRRPPPRTGYTSPRRPGAPPTEPPAPAPAPPPVPPQLPPPSIQPQRPEPPPASKGDVTETGTAPGMPVAPVPTPIGDARRLKLLEDVNSGRAVEAGDLRPGEESLLEPMGYAREGDQWVNKSVLYQPLPEIGVGQDLTQRREGAKMEEREAETKASAELFPAAETPFNLTAEKGEAPPAPSEFGGFGGEKLAQSEMFAIQKIVESKDPGKSADAAQAMYGGPAKAIPIIERQLRVMDSDPDTKRAFTKPQRAMLKEVLALLQQRAETPRAKTDAAREAEDTRNDPAQAASDTLFSKPMLGPGGELGGESGKQKAESRKPEDDPFLSAFDAVPMEMPEAVRVIKALTGVWPKVRERMRNAAGFFRFTQGEAGKGQVFLKAGIFDLLTEKEKADLRQEADDYGKATAERGEDPGKIAAERYKFLLDEAYEAAKSRNPVQALKVIWHEIGHVVDWIPDHIIRGRGNFFGRIGTLRDYLKHTLPLDPTKPAGEKLTPADKARILKEAEQSVRDDIGPIREIVRTIIVEEPEWRITGIQPNDVLNILRESAGKETPELTRWFAEQDSKVKAEILRKAMRGLLDERLEALGGKKEQIGTRRVEKTVREKVGREPTPAEIKARFAELLIKAIRERNLADLATVKAELQPLIAWWRGTETMEEYFKPSAEMYAEAFSAWANNPAAVLKRAPTYSRLIWNYLDRKPQVKALYDEIQRQIKSGEIMPGRVRSLYEMWEGDDARSLKHGREWRQATARDFYDNVSYHFDRRFGPVYRAAKGYAHEGPMREAVGTYLYRAAEHERFLAALNGGVGKRLVKAGLDWTHDLGEYLFHKRVIEERFNLANPLGWTSKNSLERLGEMQRTMGAEKWTALEEAGAEFRRLYEEFVVAEVNGGRMFTPELAAVLAERAHYATFSAIKNVPDNGIEKILESRYGAGVTPHIYRQIGNLGEIKNPATATVLKGMSLISASYRNTMKRAVVKMLQAQDPANIMPAKTRWNGKTREAIVVDNHPKVGTIVYLHEGKPQAFYVRKVVADAVNAGNPAENIVLGGLVNATGWLKGLFTQLNYGFWPVNMVRDSVGFAMQMPGTFSAAHWAKVLPRALVAARQSVTHAKPNPYADAALKRKMLISKGDPRGVYAAAENEYELKLASFGMEPAQWDAQGRGVNALVKAWNWYRELGQSAERVNKIAGMIYLDEKFPAMPEWKKREIVRERSGSPNFLERGASNPQVDLLFLFYNPWKEGLRSVVKSARENPYSFAAKATGLVLMPTILQSAAVMGLLGDERKKQYRRAGDYLLTNYLVVPLGEDADGKGVFLTLPLWEPARIAHGLLFQTLTGRGQGILSHAGGQLPSVNPVWNLGLAWSQYLTGKNPPDWFRGVNVLTDDQFAAGGWPAFEQMAKYSWNTAGGSIVNRFKNLNLEAGADTDLRAFLSLPGVNNALGRWIRVTDRGQADEARALARTVEQRKAGTRLGMQEYLALPAEDLAKAMNEIRRKMQAGEAFSTSEKLLLREPYALQYLMRRWPEIEAARRSPMLRQLQQGKSAESKAAILQGLFE